MEPAANNNLYDGVQATPPPPEIVRKNDFETSIRYLPKELINGALFSEVPLETVRTTPGFYGVSNRIGDTTYEKVVYVPNQTEFPPRPEPPMNVREGIYTLMALAGGAEPEHRERIMNNARARLAEIEANPALAFVDQPIALNIFTLAWRQVRDLPETAEVRLEAFLTRAPQARDTPFEAHLRRQYTEEDAAARRRYTNELKWSINRNPRTAASLSNLSRPEDYRYYIVFPFDRRRHALDAWARAHRILPPRNARRSRRHGRKTRRQTRRRV